MTPQVLQLQQQNFRSEVDAAGDAILRVTEGDETHMPAAIVDYFEMEYPGTFRFFTIRRDAVTVEAWWQKNFKMGYSSMPWGRAAGSPGFYLFIKGAPVDWSPGESGDAQVNALANLAAKLKPTKGPTAPEDFETAREERTSKAVAERFEQHLQRHSKALPHIQEKAAKGRAAKNSRLEELPRRMRGLFESFKKGNSAAVAEAASPTTVVDPAQLGATTAAGDDEPKGADHEKAKLNAPDKGADIDPAAPAIESAPLAKINAAWQRIKAVRGS